MMMSEERRYEEFGLSIKLELQIQISKPRQDMLFIKQRGNLGKDIVQQPIVVIVQIGIPSQRMSSHHSQAEPKR